MSHDSGVIPPLILNHNSQFILIILIYISLFPYLPSVRGDESWIMTPESSYLSYWITIPNSFKITPLYSLSQNALSKKQWIMIHDSGVIPPLILNRNFLFILIIPINEYFLSLYALSKGWWIMNHESWFIPPLTLPRTVTLLPRSIPESFSEIGPAISESISESRQDSSCFLPPITTPLASLGAWWGKVR